MLSPTVLTLSPTVRKLSPTVLKLSPIVLKVSSTVLNTLHSTDVIPHCTDVIPTYVLKLSPTVLKLSPTILSNLHSAEAITHSTDVILHSTRQAPQYSEPTLYTLYGVVFRLLQDIIASTCCAIAKTIWRPGLTDTKLQTKTSPAYFLFLSAYSDCLFKKIFRPLLNYSLGGLCHFAASGYTHAASETV